MVASDRRRRRSVEREQTLASQAGGNKRRSANTEVRRELSGTELRAPVVLRPMSAGFLRPPSPLRRPPEPLEDMELDELGSRGLLTVGNCGRL
ncbi:hypothetical protein EYF80_016784 [Liparis tanakae]|uniref:Uncharacterized protein n=1 Tax=Liparis tanakae TaxID=230148 RepID=A0A4Z2I6Q1_9TELE|nr:hypothetical protein EYF80_016784 [Liparis tanakae]